MGTQRAAGVARLIDGGLAKGAGEGEGRRLQRGDQGGCWSPGGQPQEGGEREGRGRAELCGWEASVLGVGGAYGELPPPLSPHLPPGMLGEDPSTWITPVFPQCHGSFCGLSGTSLELI